MNTSSKVLKDLFTGKDNETQDLMKWLAALAFLIALVLTCFGVFFKNVTFDIVNYGIGISGLLVALAGGLHIKRSTEPDADNTPDKETVVIEATTKTTSTTSTTP